MSKTLLKVLINSCFILSSSSSSSISIAMAAVEGGLEKAETTVSYQHVMSWALGLIVVLCVFFFCVWFVRKTGILPVVSQQKMTVITGLSLGMREKLVLVQVGDKQLVLGVSPGRIDNLLVLEGDDQLLAEKIKDESENDFSDKLKQLMKGEPHE